jgi:signal transduction histidine kinase
MWTLPRPNDPTSSKFYTKWTKIIIGLCIASAWIIICQVVFYILQDHQGLDLTKAIQVQFRSDLIGSNFEYLARSVADLESLGAIKCPLVSQVSPNSKVLLNLSFRGDCIEHPWMLSGGRFEAMMTAVNGDRYQMQFSTKNGPGFAIGIWAMRISGLLLMFSFSALQRFRIKQEAKIADVRLQSAEQLSLLATQLSHDIRSPLSALNMIVSSLSAIPEEQAAVLRNASRRINEIANELLHKSSQTSFPEAFTPVSDGRLIDLPTVLKTIITEKRAELANSGIEIRSDLTQAENCKVRFSESDLSRSLSNLINNSVEALNGRGEVVVSVRKYPDQVAIVVSDTGVGIPKEVLERIGERGFSFGKAGTGSGSGLGVWYTRKALIKAGGKLTVQSEVGQGTIVTLHLPI